jgi:hypothetical protein
MLDLTIAFGSRVESLVTLITAPSFSSILKPPTYPFLLFNVCNPVKRQDIPKPMQVTNNGLCDIRVLFKSKLIPHENLSVL